MRCGRFLGSLTEAVNGTTDVEATDWRAERAEEREGSWLYKASCDSSWKSKHYSVIHLKEINKAVFFPSRGCKLEKSS